MVHTMVVRDRAALAAFLSSDESRRRRAHESSVLDAWQRTGEATPYWLPATCAVCERPSAFLLDHQHSPVGGPPNWRERLVCATCQLNCRMRASVTLVHTLVPDRQASIWLTEQVTPLYGILRDRYPRLIGSEFLGDVAPGAVDAAGIRHEDMAGSSFEDGSLDCVVSFDVLEHVPEPALAFTEVARVLRPGGLFFWTAPFVATADATLVRAVVRPDGSVHHLTEPEYHGDPVNPSGGVLCFRHFGWDVLDELRAHGFEDPHVVAAWSAEDAVIGGEQLYFVARRAGRRRWRPRPARRRG